MQGKQKGDCSLAELRDLGLSIDIDEVLARRLKGKLLIIDGHVRQGYYLGDSAFGCEISIGHMTPSPRKSFTPQRLTRFLRR